MRLHVQNSFHSASAFERGGERGLHAADRMRARPACGSRADRRGLRRGCGRREPRLRRGAPRLWRGRGRTGLRRGVGRGMPSRRVVELEERDLLVHRLGLLLQRLGGRGVLLDQRRVLLRHLVHLRQRLVDLLDAGRLLGRWRWRCRRRSRRRS